MHIVIDDTVAPIAAPLSAPISPVLNDLARPRGEIVAALNAAAITLHAPVTGAELLTVAELAYRVVRLGGDFDDAGLSLEMRLVIGRAANATNANGGGQMRALLLMSMSAIRAFGGHPLFARSLLEKLMPVSTGQVSRAREILRGVHVRDF